MLSGKLKNINNYIKNLVLLEFAILFITNHLKNVSKMQSALRYRLIKTEKSKNK